MNRSIIISISIIFNILISCSGTDIRDIGFVPENSQILVMDKSKIVLDDGDSFEYDGMGIRVLGMDTPEIAHPEHGFFIDQPYGREAAELTEKIINNCREISFVKYQEDRYGRMLAHVFIDGNLLSIMLIKAGLAYETVSFYGDNGFPELARRILEAAEKSEPKDFIPPHQWRRENRKTPDQVRQ